jgi:hypothetical protein
MIHEFSEHILKNTLNIKFLENHSSGGGIVSCGQTDRRDESNSRVWQFLILILIYLFTAVELTPGGSSSAHIGLTPGGNSTTHIYTQHRTTQLSRIHRILHK